jgi:uncharacterized coiled-coil protein SlyX
MNPLNQSKNTTILPVLIALTLACFALSPQASATCQEGCFSNGNTAFGDDALINNSDIGYDNTAIGFDALSNNTSGGQNTAIGFDALASNKGGLNNTATGTEALLYNTNGSDNTATGEGTLLYNTTGNQNTATGAFALQYNTTGNDNTAIGTETLLLNTTGHKNTVTGALALWLNTTGFRNTAIGFDALSSNTTGGDNIALGQLAGANLTTGNDNIDIGNAGVAAEANTIRIGRVGAQTVTFIAGISGATVPTGVPVIIDSSGHLGTTTSSARYKVAIKAMGEASETILSLKPVTFRYKKILDPQGIPQFGLVAEEVEKVNPALVARDAEGKPHTVRYDAINAMLLNEFLKEHRKVQEQEATIAQLKSAVAKQEATAARQQKQIEALTAGLQKVSAQLELGKPAPRTALNGR